MTASTAELQQPLDRTAGPPSGERPDGTAAIKLVLAVEGLDTSDGRYIEPGSLTTRPMPLTLWVQPKNTHGIDGDASTWVAGSITDAYRVPGPQVTQRSTGEPFPDGTFVWLGEGWMYTDVPGPEYGGKPAYTLVKDGALYGNSVDLTAVDAGLEYNADDDAERLVTYQAAISSTTIVGLPAFMDSYVELDGELVQPSQAAGAASVRALLNGTAVPSWRSAELGDTCGPCAAWGAALDTMGVSTEKRKRATKAGHALPDGSYPIETVDDLENAIRAVGRAGGSGGTEDDRNKVRRHIMRQAKRLQMEDHIPDNWNPNGTLKMQDASGEPFQDLLQGADVEPAQMDFSTSGMVALIPVDPEHLAVPGSDPASEMHLTLAFLGDAVTSWPPEQIAAVHQIAREMTDADAQCQRMAREAIAAGDEPPNCDQLYVSPLQEGPIRGGIFAHAVFNPNGDNGHNPAAVYLLDGSGQRGYIEAAQSEACSRLTHELGDINFPDQHSPYVPHITVAYGNDNKGQARNAGASFAAHRQTGDGNGDQDGGRLSDLQQDAGIATGGGGDSGATISAGAPGGGSLRAESAHTADGGRAPHLPPGQVYGTGTSGGDGQSGAHGSPCGGDQPGALSPPRDAMGHAKSTGTRSLPGLQPGTNGAVPIQSGAKTLDGGSEEASPRSGPGAFQDSGASGQGGGQAAQEAWPAPGSAKWFLNQMTYTGPVTFDRLRVAIGNQRTDYPLGGGSAIVASAAPLPPADWFANPGLTEPTNITVTDDGRVYGHLACWDSCHIGMPGGCTTPPRSPSGYAYFQIHTTRATQPDGTVVNVPVGYGTLSRSETQGGHASIRDDALSAAEHYDNTCWAVYELAAGEDEHGIWVAGRLMPGLDEVTEHKARGVALSGDWRTVRGNLELVAALGVNVAGFPVPARARVAAGIPVSLVAAGIPARPASSLPDIQVDRGPVEYPLAGELLDWIKGQKALSDARQSVAVVAALTAPVNQEDWDRLQAEMTLAVEGDHPWFDPERTAWGDDEELTAAGRKKLRLPKYIKRIAKHLMKKGMAEGHAIASAKNAADKMCTTGDLNFPGHQDVNPGSRAEACAAIAQWKKDRPGAK